MKTLEEVKDGILVQVKSAIVSMLDLLSSELYLLPIDKKDFEFSNIALNINHKNPVVRYIARAAAASGDSGSTLDLFLEKHSLDVQLELRKDFESFYATNPTKAHDIAIKYEMLVTRVLTLLEVLLDMGYGDLTTNISKWGLNDTVHIAREDWS